MQKLLLCSNVILLTISIFITPVWAEKIIQKEKMVFETCVDVIKKSSEKLSVVPDLVIDNNNIKQANFQMSDGILSITCDKQKEEIRVKIH